MHLRLLHALTSLELQGQESLLLLPLLTHSLQGRLPPCLLLLQPGLMCRLGLPVRG
jgi:hypothetical protein